MGRTRGWLGVLWTLALLSPGLFAQQGDTYRLHAVASAHASGRSSSANYRNSQIATGQVAVGIGAGAGYRIQAGFINDQSFDVSQPPVPQVSDGTGADLDTTTDDSQLCATWAVDDAESGIFHNSVWVGTTPGAADVQPPIQVAPGGGFCMAGPIDRCRAYYTTVLARNGSGMASVPGISDGVFVDDPVDTDSDGLGDECDPDADGDGVEDVADACPCDPLNDADADGVCAGTPICGEVDNCPSTFNPGQADDDDDGLGDACEPNCRVYVDQALSAGADCGGIQECIDATTPACRVVIAPGIYPENLVIDKSIVIEGEAGASQTVLDGGNASPVIRIEAPSSSDLVRIEGLTVANGTDGIEAISDAEVVDSVIDGSGVALRNVQGISGPAPDVRAVRTTMMNGSVGLWVSAGTGRLEDCTILGFFVGARVDAGSLSLDRSWVKDASVIGVASFGGRVQIANSLVTESGSDCVRIGVGGTGTIDFSTITECSVGIDLNNSADGALFVRDSIIFGNHSQDLKGVDCDQITRSATQEECCWENGNICANPGFLDPPGSDYRLTVGSACVDAALGPADYEGQPCRDFEGVPRLLDADLDGLAQADMGAYELDSGSIRIPGTVQGVRFADTDTMVWDFEPDAVSYNVFRATLSSVGYLATWSCSGSTASTTFTLAPDDPPPGDGHLFVVEGEAEGGTRGPWRYGTCAERSNGATCP